MIKISIGKGRFHITFRKIENFTQAIYSSYLKEKKKRCWALFSRTDNLVVIQPSVSTFGLNVLILDTTNIEEKLVDGILDILREDNIKIITADCLRRPSQAQGFTLWLNADNFIEALSIFYPDGKRCRAIIPEKGSLLIQPSVSTPEKNTLVLENFDSVLKKEQIEIIIARFESIKCDTIESPTKTTNF